MIRVDMFQISVNAVLFFQVGFVSNYFKYEVQRREREGPDPLDYSP